MRVAALFPDGKSAVLRMNHFELRGIFFRDNFIRHFALRKNFFRKFIFDNSLAGRDYDLSAAHLVQNIGFAAAVKLGEQVVKKKHRVFPADVARDCALGKLYCESKRALLSL